MSFLKEEEKRRRKSPHKVLGYRTIYVTGIYVFIVKKLNEWVIEQMHEWINHDTSVPVCANPSMGMSAIISAHSPPHLLAGMEGLRYLGKYKLSKDY